MLIVRVIPSDKHTIAVIAFASIPRSRDLFSGSYPPFGLDPWNDVGDEVSADPPHRPVIDIRHLKQGGHLWIPGTTINVEDVCHPSVV